MMQKRFDALAAKDARIRQLELGYDELRTVNNRLQARATRAEKAEQEAIELWARIHRLEAEAKGPDGFATWKDAATDERVRRVRAEQEAAGLRADALRYRTIKAAPWAAIRMDFDPMAPIYIHRESTDDLDGALDRLREAARAGGAHGL